MRRDKKNRDERMNFTLLSDIGDAVFDRDTQADIVIDSLNYYQRWVG